MFSSNPDLSPVLQISISLQPISQMPKDFKFYMSRMEFLLSLIKLAILSWSPISVNGITIHSVF